MVPRQVKDGFVVVRTAVLPGELAAYPAAKIVRHSGRHRGDCGQLLLHGFNPPRLVCDGSGRRSINSAPDLPEGKMECPDPTCAEMLDIPQGESAMVVCGKGHIFDLDELEARWFENPGGYGHSGLPNTLIGLIGETIIAENPNLHPVGVVERSFGYHGPFDFIVKRRKGRRVFRHGAELKTLDVTGRYPAFKLGSDEKESKYGDIRRSRLLGEALVGIIVWVDFKTLKAGVYSRLLFYTGTWRPASKYLVDVVDFTDIYERLVGPLDQNIPKSSTVVKPKDEIPF